MKELLIVVDYQKDFVDGALGFPGAETLDGPIAARMAQVRAGGGDVIFTMDTHGDDYAATVEGTKLPVPHSRSLRRRPSPLWTWPTGSGSGSMTRWSCAGWCPTSACSPTPSW